MTKTISYAELKKILNSKIRASSVNALSKKWKFPQSYIYRVWKDEKKISPKLALKLGFKLITGTYKKA